MPLYTYKCEVCKSLQDFILKYDEEPEEKCKVCRADSRALHRILANPAYGKHSSWSSWNKE